MDQRTWLITGVTSGFGRALTEQLLARGDRVAGTTRKPELLDELSKKYGDRLWLTQLELTDEKSCRSAADKAFSKMSHIDVVVSSAGYGLVGAAEELSADQIRHQVDTNLMGPIHFIRAVIPHLREQKRGRILQISASGGQIAFPGFSIYHATKWGIEGFVESVAQEVAPFGIGFTIVEPGGNKTDFAASVVTAPPMNVYDKTPIGELRKAIASNSFPLPGDPKRVAKAMIDSVNLEPAPKRLSLGSDTYTAMHAALKERLHLLEEQRDLAFSTDAH